jgi:hypothetical protein
VNCFQRFVFAQAENSRAVYSLPVDSLFPFPLIIRSVVLHHVWMTRGRTVS